MMVGASGGALRGGFAASVLATLFFALSVAASFLMPPHVRAAAPRLVAVPDAGFSDSSGEARDQGADHVARLRALSDELRTEIVRDGALASLPLACGQTPCPLDADAVAALRERARQGGAAYILLASVHKMSTLVMAMKVDVFEVESGRLVASKLLSFRGDTDEGWSRAGAFVAKDVATAIVKGEGAK